jgi:hypothetical protein
MYKTELRKADVKANALLDVGEPVHDAATVWWLRPGSLPNLINISHTFISHTYLPCRLLAFTSPICLSEEASSLF